MLFFAETFAAFDGLGYLILDGMERRDYADMYAAVMALSLLGILFYRIFYVLEKKCCQWKRQHD